MKRRVFHIYAEVRPVTKAIFDPAAVNGAFVRCLVPTNTPGNAMKLLKAQLKADGLALVSTEWCVDFDDTEWENPGDEYEENMAQMARETGQVQYDVFHTWGHDAPDAI